MSRTNKKNKKNQKNDLNLDPALVEVIENFSACGRCSYFWAGYQVIVGEAAILTAVLEDDPIWINLPWSHPVRELVVKSYGIPFDVDYFHHEGSCKECQRPFVYYEDDVEVAVVDDVESPEAKVIESVFRSGFDDEETGARVVVFAIATDKHFKIARMPGQPNND